MPFFCTSLLGTYDSPKKKSQALMILTHTISVRKYLKIVISKLKYI